MKTIVVPTDFSAPAENAMLFAGQLANAINASVLLFHAYQAPLPMNDAPLLTISIDELQENAERALDNAKQLLSATVENLEVKTVSRLGDIIVELNDVCDQVKPFAIVMGKHGATGMQRMLFGSTTLSIIRHTTHPVIAVPENQQQGDVKNIALAIDGSGKLPIEKIKSLVDGLKTKLHLIHVRQTRSESLDLNELVAAFNSTCTTIEDDKFIHGIQTYIANNNIDMLIVLPHKHNVFEKLFVKAHTPELLQKLTIPIMCINED